MLRKKSWNAEARRKAKAEGAEGSRPIQALWYEVGRGHRHASVSPGPPYTMDIAAV